jgi:chemosensory pili system protein ChpA (sensor histidine kinase/response regulator)
LESESFEASSEDLDLGAEALGLASDDLGLGSESFTASSEDLDFEISTEDLDSEELGLESEDLGLGEDSFQLESEASSTEAFLDFGAEESSESWDLDFGDDRPSADTSELETAPHDQLELDDQFLTEEPIAEALPETAPATPEPQPQTTPQVAEEDSEFDLELLGLDETFTGRISDSERAALTQELSQLDLEVEAAFDPELVPGGEILDEEFDLDLANDFYGESPGLGSININTGEALGSVAELETPIPAQDGEPDLGWGDFTDQDFDLPATNDLLQSEISEFETLSEDSLLRDDLFESLDPSGSASLTDEWGDLDSILEAPGLPQELDDFAQLDGLLDSSPSSETSLDNLDNLENLDALLDGPMASNGNGASLDDLDSLLEAPSPPPPPEPDAGLGTLDEDLSDLMLQADMLGGPPVAAGLGQPGRRAVVTQQSMKVPVKQLDNLNNLVGEMVVNRNSLETDQERLRQSIDKLLYQVQQLGDVGQRLQDLYERSLLENALLASRQSVMLPQRSSHHEDSSHHDGFDALEMDRFSGFHLLSQEMIELIVRVRESASDIDYIVNEPLDYVARNFRQVTTQLQEGLTRARMVPFEQGMTRLPRAVREVTGRCGKQAKLILEGKETLVDKVLLEQLYNPMTHLVNNAVTHGIETPEERLKAGKPAEGKIQIQAFHQGNQTVIVVSDDGAGIDAERVRRKAIEKGLVSRAEAATLNELQLYDFLFHPGFSTKDKADDFSGRGVGMDVVRTNLQNMRGSINTDSVRGKGTTFTIRLPLTLSISKSLCCISNRARIAFPMDGVEDMLDVPEDRVQRNAQDQPCIQWRDQLIRFRPLSDLLRFNRQTTRSTVYGGTQDDDMLSIVILRTAGEYIALQVDRVEGEKEIVIKQLEGPIPKPTGIAGVTVMSDGQVMPIADVLELIDLAKGRSRQTPSMLWEQEPVMQEEAPHEPLVLIVDDSIVVRELLSMTFNKSGYRVEQARDGQEAWEKLRSGLPCDIVFCDIEMPRMTGLELLEKLQKDQTLKNLPIAMLTSRGADRHRQMATQLGARGYFTKPYLEEALLEAASRMLKGEVLVGAAV